MRNSGADPFWKEYAGACLRGPLLANSTYRFQFDVGFVSEEASPPIDISFFGTTDCDYLPFGNDQADFGCPSNSPNWSKLAEVTVSASGEEESSWTNSLLEVTPDEDIFAIAIGPDCSPVFNEVSTYYFFDNLLLANIEFFDFQIAEVNHPCSDDFRLSIPYNPDFEYQWYLDGVALDGETTSELSQIYGEGSYQIRIVNGTICRLSTSFEYEIPVFAIPEQVSICQDETYLFGEIELADSGFYLDTFKTVNNCDSIVALDLQVIGAEFDTLEASILEGETFELEGMSYTDPGDYMLSLTSSTGCDSLVLLQLNTFNIYIPNIFSPNGDGINDSFMPLTEEGNIDSYEMQIYDRWGNLIYEGVEWDGFLYRPGVYAYLIDIEFGFGSSKVFWGSVTMVE